MGKFKGTVNMPFLRYTCLISILIYSLPSSADNKLPSGPKPISLKELSIPIVPGLLDGQAPIIVDKKSAIILGKALFWDTNVGSDGMACASCHFHAGADSRIKNQLSPKGQSTPPNKIVLNDFSANHSLSHKDFPFYQLENPLQENTQPKHDKPFVTGSAGTFGGFYQSNHVEKSSFEDCKRSVGDAFHTNGLAARRVTPRNAPTVINSIFNHRNFWDGRANNIFNGSNSWGDRDVNAGVWVTDSAHKITKQRLHLANASLASLATAPPLNSTEMSCSQRTLKHIARKLLPRQPLDKQKVHWNDSVLAQLSFSNKKQLKSGLNTTYEKLIQKAFHDKYWNYNESNPEFGKPLEGEPDYQQIEANFALFFGLAIQLYEATLVSDEAPFDNSRRDKDNRPIDLSAAELNGLDLFRINLCSTCHLGPNFTASAVNANAALAKTSPEVFSEVSTTTNVVNRIPVFLDNKPLVVFSDIGFSSTGVARATDDIGLDGNDVFGNPLSFSKQYLQFLAGQDEQVKDTVVKSVRSCDFPTALAVNFKPSYRANSVFNINDGVHAQPQDNQNCFLNPAKNAFLPTKQAAKAELNKVNSNKMLAEVGASFKIPSLRNIELTGPYMHNGSMASLEQVIEFYARGGNFANDAKETTLVFSLPELKFSEKNRRDLIAFLKTLTDERVRYQRAPFDHPELVIPHGHTQTGQNIADKVLAKDDFLVIPAVGSLGANKPLKSFDSYLSKD